MSRSLFQHKYLRSYWPYSYIRNHRHLDWVLRSSATDFATVRTIQNCVRIIFFVSRTFLDSLSLDVFIHSFHVSRPPTAVDGGVSIVDADAAPCPVYDVSETEDKESVDMHIPIESVSSDDIAFDH